MSLTPRARRALLLAGLLLAAIGLRVADWWDDRPDPEGTSATRVATQKAPRHRLPTRFFNPDAVPAGDASADGAPSQRSDRADAPERIVLRCTLVGDPLEAEHAFLRTDERDLPGHPVNFTDDGFFAGYVPPSGSAVLVAPGYPPVPVTWADGQCDPVVVEAEEPARLTVRVEDPLAAYPVSDPVFVKGCGVPWMRVDPGAPIEVRVPPREPCTLDAWRMDGMFRALALPELVELEPGEDLELTMVLPGERMGGMGFQFQPLDDSVAVRRVYEDTPAWDAGLRSGDRILAVDGEPTDDMDPNDFVLLGTGPEGSVVHLEVEQEDGTVVEVDIERALLN